jgi:hypothetical protein
MESLDAGWLFLITNAPGSGWLLSVGAPAAELIGKSRLVALQVAGLIRGAGWEFFVVTANRFSAMSAGMAGMRDRGHDVRPHLRKWNGNRGSGSDSGSGGGASLRKRGRGGSLLAHYEGRLTAGFRKHLELCGSFYRSGGDGAWWRNEASELQSNGAMRSWVRLRVSLTGW